MQRVDRVELHQSDEIPASAADVWALLTDWGGMMHWSLSAKRASPLGMLVKCELIGRTHEVPRRRRMMLDSGITVEEELIYQNDETRRIHYRKTDTFGTSAYIASSYVEAIDDGRCRLHILSWFDAGDDPSSAARYKGIYQGIFDGFKAYFSIVDAMP